jgi:hypothetical protein
MKSMEKADWVVLRLLMVACRTNSEYGKLECARGVEYLLKKYGSRVLQDAIKALRKEERR